MHLVTGGNYVVCGSTVATYEQDGERYLVFKLDRRVKVRRGKVQEIVRNSADKAKAQRQQRKRAA